MRIVVAEDAPLLREGIVHVLTRAEMDVVAQAADADDLRRKTRAHHPDVIVADIRMPPANTDDGLRAALALRADHPGLGVLVFSQYLEAIYARELFEAGTEGMGYLLKDRVGDIDSFVDSVRRVGQGGSVLDPDVVALLVGRHHPTTPVTGLTDRERTVVALIAQGQSNLAIAGSLHLSQASVEKHIHSIFTKLNLPNDPNTHRRVLTVLTYLQTGRPGTGLRNSAARAQTVHEQPVVVPTESPQVRVRGDRSPQKPTDETALPDTRRHDC